MSYFNKNYFIVLFLIFLFLGCPHNDNEPFTEEKEISDEVIQLFNADPEKEDTDGDGLTDIFEIKYCYPFHMPDNIDSNSDGLIDSDEDIDNDGLIATQEQKYGTNPLLNDSDDDGLNDYDEIFIHNTDPNLQDTDFDGLTDNEEISLQTDPNLIDTDNDGILDSNEEFQTIVDDSYNEIEVSVKGEGNLSKYIQIDQLPESNKNFYNALGQISKAYNISFSDEIEASDITLTSATITLYFEYDNISNDDINNFEIFTFDENQKFWVPTSTNYEIDIVNSCISVNVTHFSIYALFNRNNWELSWKELKDVCPEKTSIDRPPSDVAFVIDSSGSMKDNDPNNIRIESAIKFLEAFEQEDRGLVIDFDTSASVFQSLTSNKEKLISAFNRIDSYGGTDIDDGLLLAYNELINNSDSSRNRSVILLTDGKNDPDPYDHTAATLLAKQKIRVLVIGLSDNTDETVLGSIANTTDGLYRKASHADDLPQVFVDLSTVLGDDGTDTDEDGLTDCQEIQGFRLLSGRLVQTNPYEKDTDGDGLLDSDEISERFILRSQEIKINNGIEFEKVTFRNLNSDPTESDSDFDGLSDLEEFDLETNPQNIDSDGDGVSDFQEVSYGSDPTLKNTDGDEFEDSYEFQHLEDGLSPIHFDEKISKLDYSKDFFIGAVAGELYPIEGSIPWLLGNLSSGTAPNLAGPPGVVAAAVADFRDTLGAAFQGDFIGAGFNAAGLIPVGGDIAKITKKSASFILKNIDKADEVFCVIAKTFPEDIAVEVIPEIAGDGIKRLIKDLRKRVSSGFVGKVELILLAKTRSKLKLLGELPSSVFRSCGELFTDWRKTEEYMIKIFYGGPDNYKQVATYLKSGDIRKYDFIKEDIPGNVVQYILGCESKMGHVTYSAFTKKQIEKDIKLIKELSTESLKHRVAWHFFASEKTGIGATKKVFEALDKANIQYFIHMP